MLEAVLYVTTGFVAGGAFTYVMFKPIVEDVESESKLWFGIMNRYKEKFDPDGHWYESFAHQELKKPK